MSNHNKCVQYTDIEDSIIQERDIEITNIKQHIKDVNELFRTIAECVDYQAGYVDNIQTNITVSKENVKYSNRMLAKAEKEQDTCVLF
jgi:t-SNARE complex subunit (syntaxin)